MAGTVPVGPRSGAGTQTHRHALALRHVREAERLVLPHGVEIGRHRAAGLRGVLVAAHKQHGVRIARAVAVRRGQVARRQQKHPERLYQVLVAAASKSQASTSAGHGEHNTLSVKSPRTDTASEIQRTKDLGLAYSYGSVPSCRSKSLCPDAKTWSSISEP